MQLFHRNIQIPISFSLLFCRHVNSFNLASVPTFNKKNRICHFISTSSPSQENKLISSSSLYAVDSYVRDGEEKSAKGGSTATKTPLSMSINELGTEINGKGRALTTWDCYKVGLDPLYFFNRDDDGSGGELWDHNVHDLINRSSFDVNADEDGDDVGVNVGSVIAQTTKREQLINQYMPAKRREIHRKEQGKGMGNKALDELSDLYPNSLGIEYSIASLVNIQRSSDGTVKLLLKLNGRKEDTSSRDDGKIKKPQQDFFIESVIIPWYDRANPSSTLCVSTQVGCAQGCTFCATGKMGLMKRLTSDEILIQLYYAKKICRILNGKNDDGVNLTSKEHETGDSNNNHKEGNEERWLPDVDNIVFMGMGDSGDNADSVIDACSIMADRQCFAIAQNKITISTVGPNPEVFQTLGQADAVLAWSVHAVNDTLRKKLVPTTKYTMNELKEGLVEALMSRSKRMRAIMFEVTLIEDVNDGIKEAEEMVEFCLEMKNQVKGMKLVVNLIPFNDIGHRSYKKSPHSNVAAFQRVLVNNGVKTYVRTTRGDDENAACGQLATKKLKGKYN